MNKPPLGVMPKEMWDEKRLDDLLQALKRYSQNCIPFPLVWVEELLQLLKVPYENVTDPADSDGRLSSCSDCGQRLAYIKGTSIDIPGIYICPTCCAPAKAEVPDTNQTDPSTGRTDSKGDS